ncbi:hypothetical protein TL16_g09118 [Triparma laevis f. inornata]|uniref:Uncharacterized protein n=1 Tax=Triparma laevis f. inornata TaxID=1714386 RepID=A0A9W7EK53_9STRA|nr:hypothetical protein TL16_g09118 [Triparma laevis f. inornata]
MPPANHTCYAADTLGNVKYQIPSSCPSRILVMPGFISWMLTPEFRRHLLAYIPLEMLLTMGVISKEFEEMTREYIIRRIESGKMIFHRGVNIVFDPFNSSGEERQAFMKASARRNKLVTQVIFLQNLPRVGEHAFMLAISLVIVDIPEGVEIIGASAFTCCAGLTNIFFPRTLTSIETIAFQNCPSLDNVDLLHTNLQEIGDAAFTLCSELKEMTIPESLQTLGRYVFGGCSKIVPSSIDVNDEHNDDDVTSEVVAHLRSKMSLNALLSGNNFLNTDDFRRLIVPFLPNDVLLAIGQASKPWSRVADGFISAGVASGKMIVNGGEDADDIAAWSRQGR